MFALWQAFGVLCPLASMLHTQDEPPLRMCFKDTVLVSLNLTGNCVQRKVWGCQLNRSPNTGRAAMRTLRQVPGFDTWVPYLLAVQFGIRDTTCQCPHAKDDWLELVYRILVKMEWTDVHKAQRTKHGSISCCYHSVNHCDRFIVPLKCVLES